MIARDDLGVDAGRLLQLLARLAGGSSPGAAMAAGRWANAGELVRVEGHAPERWVEGLRARGHRVVRAGAFSPEFGQAQLIVLGGDGEHLAGASDRRNLGWMAAAL
jgi:gamma-glutamyltranspeptidase